MALESHVTITEEKVTCLVKAREAKKTTFYLAIKNLLFCLENPVFHFFLFLPRSVPSVAKTSLKVLRRKFNNALLTDSDWLFYVTNISLQNIIFSKSIIGSNWINYWFNC